MARTFRSCPLWIIGCIGLVFGTHAGFAETVHYDVLITSQAGSLVTGGYDDGASTGIAPLQIFGGDVVGLGTLGPYESAEEPGFRAVTQAFLNDSSKMTPSNSYSALPSTTDIFLNFIPMTISGNSRNIFFWNGSGTVAFAPLANSYQLNLVGVSGTTSVTGASNGTTSSFLLKQTSLDGSLDPGHPHLTTQIANAGAAPEQGFYLFALGFSMEGFVSSQPAYFVYGAYDADAPPDFSSFDASHDLAKAWVQTNLVAVPEPSSIALAGLGVAGALAAGWRRRRRAAAAKSAVSEIAR